jgi:hypothetical protein
VYIVGGLSDLRRELLLGIDERGQKDSETLLTMNGTIQKGSSTISNIDEGVAMIGQKVDQLLSQSKPISLSRLPCFIVPFEDQGNNFVGREKELATIANLFESGSKRVALYGLGGVG